MGRTAWEPSSVLTAMVGMEPLRAALVVGEPPAGLEAVPARFARELPPLEAAVMLAWREVSSCIIRSFWSCLSAWTVWACWRRLSRRENCLEQWQVNGLSPVCFLGRVWMSVSVTGVGTRAVQKGRKRRVGSSTAGKRGEDGMEKEGVRT